VPVEGRKGDAANTTMLQNVIEKKSMVNLVRLACGFRFYITESEDFIRFLRFLYPLRCAKVFYVCCS